MQTTVAHDPCARPWKPNGYVVSTDPTTIFVFLGPTRMDPRLGWRSYSGGSYVDLLHDSSHCGHLHSPVRSPICRNANGSPLRRPVLHAAQMAAASGTTLTPWKQVFLTAEYFSINDDGMVPILFGRELAITTLLSPLQNIVLE